jgi:hypothetical protein
MIGKSQNFFRSFMKDQSSNKNSPIVMTSWLLKTSAATTNTVQLRRNQSRNRHFTTKVAKSTKFKSYKIYESFVAFVRFVVRLYILLDSAT